MFYKFLWNNANDKIKRTVVIQDYEFGGLKMIDIKTFMHSLKCTWLRRLSNMNNKFSHMVESTCPTLKSIYKYSSDYIKMQLHQDLNPFWRDVLYSYLNLSLNINPTNGQQS